MRQNEIEIMYVDDRISYIKATENPLSADVGIIRGDTGYWIFDVGNTEESAQYINKLQGRKNIILSHFHPDHTGNLHKICERHVYLGKNTFGYINEGETIADTRVFRDGVKIKIFPMPSTHAKGSMAMEVNEKVMFVGDALYANVRKNLYGYNVQLLKEAIEIIKSSPAEYIFLSHREKPLQKKNVVLKWMEGIYDGRKPGEPFVKAKEISSQ